MLFLAILLPASWLIIYLLEKRNILSQWLKPAGRRLGEAGSGLSVAATTAVATNLFLAFTSGGTIRLNPDATFYGLTQMAYRDLVSVLVEELLFRGVALYLLLKYLQTNVALLVGAAAFGIYHWFSYGVLGSPPAMVVVFLVTGLMGYVFSLAYYRTGSLVLPIGIHLGWNWVVNTLLPLGTRPGSLFQVDKSAEMAGWGGMLSVVVHLAVAGLLLLFVRSRFLRSEIGK